MISEALKNLPWEVAGCSILEHGPEKRCHSVRDSTGAVLLHSVTREVAEAFAGIPALMADIVALEDALRVGAASVERLSGYTKKAAPLAAGMRATASRSDLGALLLTELAALKNARANADEQLQMTHRQVAEVARLLDPEVTPDAWGLHAAVQKVLAERDVLRERVAALEKGLAETEERWRGASENHVKALEYGAGEEARTAKAVATARSEALADARNAALEEAALRVDVEAQESHTREAADLLDDVAKRIRAMKTARGSVK